jgi:lipopolysaccharide biosynthesis glycosyltransferase
MDKICAFSTADDSYIPSAAASLLSIRYWNKDIPLYIISSRISRKSKKLLQTLDIKYIELNLKDVFSKTWEYPIECYYLFAGPQALLQKGFTHSLYIDGDIYCNNDPVVPLSSIKAFAGVPNGTIAQILGDDYQKVTDKWSDSSATAATQRLQSGVLYFNNTFLESYGFLEKIGALFQKSLAEGIPRKGDDSLFALFQHVYPNLDYKRLPEEYNFITQTTASNQKQWLSRNDHLTQDAIFFHFTQHAKPWEIQEDYPDYTYKYFTRQWRLRLIDMFSDKALKRYFPQIHSLLQDSHLKFYWYPSENVGDLITPYFLKKAGHVRDQTNQSISEEEITAIESNATKPNRGAYCVSTGSVIRLCGDQALVFGSGIRSADQEVHRSFVRSVRGPLTRNRFLQEGYECPPIYGDPGLLLPDFYKSRSEEKTHKLGIIPHFTEYEQVAAMYSNNANVLVINLGHGDLEKAIDEIVSCETTVSSSLHGLVLSHAYGVPTRRIIFSDNIFGDGTKFSDYYQGIDLDPLSYINASGFTKLPIAKLISMKKENLHDLTTSRLLDAMFFDRDGMRPSARYPY